MTGYTRPSVVIVNADPDGAVRALFEEGGVGVTTLESFAELKRLPLRARVDLLLVARELPDAPALKAVDYAQVCWGATTCVLMPLPFTISPQESTYLGGLARRRPSEVAVEGPLADELARRLHLDDTTRLVWLAWELAGIGASDSDDHLPLAHSGGGPSPEDEARRDDERRANAEAAQVAMAAVNVAFWLHSAGHAWAVPERVLVSLLRFTHLLGLPGVLPGFPIAPESGRLFGFLDLTKFLVLDWVLCSNAEGIMPAKADVAAYLGRPDSGLRDTIDFLVAADLLVRGPRRELRVTPAGRRLHAQATRSLDRAFARAVVDVSPDGALAVERAVEGLASAQWRRRSRTRRAE